ncbi:MAG: flagellar biosynthesis regulator FlaF [Rhodospirillales bacterium]|jgi:flagellar protein FlaF|nr:flagellar biosynthesis regulator FlaF [Rhodospirillales bacterium]
MLDRHRNAADAYARSSRTTPDQRALEADALLKAARRLEDARDGELPNHGRALDEALLYNRKLWTIFATEAADGADRLPAELRNNIANIAVFVFKRSLDLLAAPAPEKIDALIEINRSIAAGLLTRPERPAGMPAAAATGDGPRPAAG